MKVRFTHIMLAVLSLCLVSVGSYAMIGGQTMPPNPNGMGALYPASIGMRIKYFLTESGSTTSVSSTCTGCRIAPDLFLTAGHCLSGFAPLTAKVDILTSGGNRINDVQMQATASAGFPLQGGDTSCGYTGDCSDVAMFAISPTVSQKTDLDKMVDIARLKRDSGAPGSKVTLTGAGCKNPAVCVPGSGTNNTNFDDGQIKYKETEVDEYGAVSDLGSFIGLGESSYAQIEDIPITLPGDSGGCVYDPDGYVVGVHSHGKINEDFTEKDMYFATFRPDPMATWFKNILSLECVYAGESVFGNGIHCRKPPEKNTIEPGKKVWIVKIADDVRNITACKKAERSSFCGPEAANEAVFQCYVGISQNGTPNCMAQGICAIMEATSNECTQYR